MVSVISVHFDILAAMPTPGKMNMLLHCEATSLRPLCSRGGQGLPAAKSRLPSVHLTAFSKVTSARELGLESGKISGLSHVSIMALQTSSVHTGPAPVRPKSACGLKTRMTSARSVSSLPPGTERTANLPAHSLGVGLRVLLIRPSMSNIQMRERAVSSLSPACIMTLAMPSAQPQAEEPAPKKSTRASFSEWPCTFMPLMKPAAAMAAVPCTSSLKKQYFCLYFCR
mmetsp:Transcript_47782/g.123355  ORF Transcript_47782/g.123355 Transcript_47782/m.123355 type:complete len:227 (+) Transcript_47782:153-833(+)